MPCATAHDPGVCASPVLAQALWLLGYPDQALQQSQEALTLAQELAHPLQSGACADLAADGPSVAAARGQARTQQAEAAHDALDGAGVCAWVAEGTILRGWALAEQGQGGGGMAQIRQGLAAERATGAELTTVFLGPAGRGVWARRTG